VKYVKTFAKSLCVLWFYKNGTWSQSGDAFCGCHFLSHAQNFACSYTYAHYNRCYDQRNTNDYFYSWGRVAPTTEIEIKILKGQHSEVIKPWNTIVGLADSGQFNSSVASFFVWLVNRCAFGHLRSFRFCTGSGFGSSRPDVSVSVRWRNHADPTLWLE